MKKLFYFIWITFCFLYVGCSDDEVESKFELSTDAISFYSQGGENIISVNTGRAWIASSDADWCTLSPAAGESAGSIIITVEKNTADADRQGSIAVVSGGKTLTVKVTQSRKAELLLSRSSLMLASGASSDTLMLIANGNWTAKTEATWFHLNAMSGEAGNVQLQFSVDRNEGDQDRTAEVVFSIPNSDKSLVLSVLQYNVNGSPQVRDSMALVKIYSLLDEPGKLMFKIWNPAKPFSTWTGVTTKKIGGYTRVVNLSLFSVILNVSYSPWESGASLPEEIGDLDELTQLNLSDVGIVGELPASIGKLTKLKSLDLSCNNFLGKLPAEMSVLTQLQMLDLTSNEFTGDVPEYIGAFTELKTLKFGYNYFDQIPDKFANLTKLDTLLFPVLLKWTSDGVVDSAALKSLNRTFPKSLLSLTNLQRLDMSDCGMTGALPEGIGNMTGIQYFLAYNNRFSGSIPSSFSQMTNLVTINLANNNLENSIPASLGNCIWLYNLILSNNRLTGGIPAELKNCKNLQSLDLCNNRLTGTLPSGLFEEGSHFLTIDISRNQLGGEIPASLGKQKSMEVFIANNNEFTGIHTDIADAISLSVLNLSHNKLESIPVGISYLTYLTTLDLKYNNITGTIPSFLSKLRRLAHLGLAGNKLSGAIPQWMIDHTAGNIGLNFKQEICPQQDGVMLDNCPDRPSGGVPGGEDGIDNDMGV